MLRAAAAKSLISPGTRSPAGRPRSGSRSRRRCGRVRGWMCSVITPPGTLR